MRDNRVNPVFYERMVRGYFLARHEIVGNGARNRISSLFQGRASPEKDDLSFVLLEFIDLDRSIERSLECLSISSLLVVNITQANII